MDVLKNMAEGFGNLGKHALGIANPDVEVVAAKRLEICHNNCEWGKGRIKCGICHCVLSAKTRAMNETCPIDKW